LAISNHNSFRMLSKKLLPYILFEKYTNILALDIASPEKPALCQLYRHTFVPFVIDVHWSVCVSVCLSVCRSCCRFRDMTHHNQGHGGHAVRLELEFLAASRRSGSRSKSSSRSCSRPEVLVRAKVESWSDPDTYSGPDPNFDPGAWRFLYNSRASRF